MIAGAQVAPGDGPVTAAGPEPADLETAAPGPAPPYPIPERRILWSRVVRGIPSALAASVRKPRALASASVNRRFSASARRLEPLRGSAR